MKYFEVPCVHCLSRHRHTVYAPVGTWCPMCSNTTQMKAKDLAALLRSAGWTVEPPKEDDSNG